MLDVFRRRIVLALLAAALAACGARPTTSAEPRRNGGPGQPGASVASLSLVSVGGEPIVFASLRGRVVLLDVFATWSLPSLARVPRLQALDRHYRGRGVTVLGLGLDLEGEQVLGPFREELGVEYPVLLATPEVREGDSPLGPLPAVPLIFLIDREGRIARVLAGEGALAETERLVREMVAR